MKNQKVNPLTDQELEALRGRIASGLTTVADLELLDRIVLTVSVSPRTPRKGEARQVNQS